MVISFSFFPLSLRQIYTNISNRYENSINSSSIRMCPSVLTVKEEIDGKIEEAYELIEARILV